MHDGCSNSQGLCRVNRCYTHAIGHGCLGIKYASFIASYLGCGGVWLLYSGDLVFVKIDSCTLGLGGLMPSKYL